MDKKFNDLVNDMIYGKTIDRLMVEKNISLEEARKIINEMSFVEYHKFTEATLTQPTNSFSTMKPTYPNPKQVDQTNIPHKFDAYKEPKAFDPNQPAQQIQQVGTNQDAQVHNEDIPGPSGDTIGPGVQSNTTQSTNAPTQMGSQNIKSLWPGKGAPVEIGMTVGLKGPNNVPVPGQITQVDNAAKGAKVRNPTTGQEQWMDVSTIQPYNVSGQKPSGPPQPESPASSNIQSISEEDKELARLCELAGIMVETCSAGATGAGSIAIAPTAVGGGIIKRRPSALSEFTKEYTPTVAKTVIGDTKPHQASGELSANLAASGKKTASRINNGRKRRR